MIMTVRQIKHQTCIEKLREIGCTVIAIEGVMFLIKYRLNNKLKLTYFYHLNEDNTYYLERIKPYVIGAGTFNSEEEVVDAIIYDIKQLNNAANSHNFDDFIDFIIKLSESVKAFDDLFLYYNISKEDIQSLYAIINNINLLFSKIKEHSGKIELES